MYITINNIKGEKRIDLSYSIQNFDSGQEITVRIQTLNPISWSVPIPYFYYFPYLDSSW